MDQEFQHDEDIIEEFDRLTKNADRVQRETLARILEESGGTEYLSKWGLNGDTDSASFKARIPLVTYSDVEPYIERIIAGESSLILTGSPISAFTMSSGTSQAKPKTHLFNVGIAQSFLQMRMTCLAFRNREFPIVNGVGLHILLFDKQSKTKAGRPVGSVTANVARTLAANNQLDAMGLPACSPGEVTHGHDFEQSLYCHLLSGLLHWDQVQYIYSTFALNVAVAFCTFERVWKELCHDIRQGVLSSRITDTSVRAAMSKQLLQKANPKLADLVEETCVGLLSSNWYGLIPKLFPSVKYIHAVMTGTMQPYLKKLRHYIGGDKVALVNGNYGASEGMIGVNINPELPPEWSFYVVIPNIAYYEFIPLITGEESSEFKKKDQTDCSEPKPVGLTEVEVGQEYEVVITNSAGLYRYRLGDVVKIVGFHNSTPKLQFVCRSNVLLSLSIEKTTDQNDLQLAVEEASEILREEKLEVVDFTSRLELSTVPGHYVFIWELNCEASGDEIMKQCCNTLERSFRDTSYAFSRKANSIGALELQVVRSGTFQKVAAHYFQKGTSFNQFKTPRSVRPTNDEVLQILSSNVIASYFSTTYSSN